VTYQRKSADRAGDGRDGFEFVDLVEEQRGRGKAGQDDDEQTVDKDDLGTDLRARHGQVLPDSPTATR